MLTMAFIRMVNIPDEAVGGPEKNNKMDKETAIFEIIRPKVVI